MAWLMTDQQVGGIAQVAFVVEQIEEGMEAWAGTLRVGPFFYLPHFPLVDARYLGRPIELDIDVALAFSGTTCFELIAQRSAGPSPFKHATNGLQLGFHHWATTTTSFDEELARRQREGASLVGSATAAVGGRLAYLQQPGMPGMLELIEWTPRVAELFEMIRVASRDWDGSEPIRRLRG